MGRERGSKCVTPLEVEEVERPSGWGAGGCRNLKGPFGKEGLTGERCLSLNFCADISIRGELAPDLGNNKRWCLQRAGRRQ